LEPESAVAPACGPVTFTLYPAEVAQATGTEDAALGGRLIAQAAHALWAPADQSEAERRAGVQAAVAALKGLAPRDALEGLLATQMVAVHNTAMECLRRAQAEGQTGDGRDRSLRQAVRLADLYARQAETLDRRRGRAPHSIRVEQVTVEAGGQAVVGAVNMAGPAQVDGPARPSVHGG